MTAPSLSSALPVSPAGNSYRELFRKADTLGFFIAGMVARFPSGMMTLSVMMMLTHTRPNYSLPSLVASTCILANALIAPQLSRLADRYGQSRVALPAMAVAVTAFGSLIAGARLVWPDWSLFVAAVGAGCIPNFGAFSRARWSSLYPGSHLMRRAFALEALCEEMVWTCAPLIVIWCSTRLFAEAGLAAAAALFLSGGLIFCAHRSTEPQPHGPTAPVVARSAPPRGKRRLARPAIFYVAVLLPSLAMFGFGGFFGVVEVSTTALAKGLGVPGEIFYPLSLCAVGSFIGGSFYGARHWALPLRRQLLVVAGIFFLSTLLFFCVGGIGWLKLFCFLSGVMIAPMITISMALIEDLVPKARLTESMTWALVSPLVGMALGAAIAGPLVDWVGAQRAFYAVSFFGALTFAIAWLGQRWLVANGTPESDKSGAC